MNEFATHQAEGFTITSNNRSAEQMAETFKKPDEKSTETPKDGAGTTQEPDHKETATPIPEKVPIESKHAKPKDDPKARVEQLARQRAEDRDRANAAERRADEIERRARAAEAELEKLRGGKPEPVKEAPKADSGPQEDDFEKYSDFIDARSKWVANQEYKTLREAEKEAEKRESFVRKEEEHYHKFRKDLNDAIEADPTLVDRISPDVVGLLPEGPVDPSKPLNSFGHLGQFIKKYGVPAMEYFSNNLPEIQRLSTLHPEEFWMELGIIKDVLRKGQGAATTASVPDPRVSRAHAPVRPVTASATTGSSSDDVVDFANSKFVKERQAELKRKYR